MKLRKRPKSIFPLLNGIILCLVGGLCLYPMLYIVFASLSEPAQIMKHSGLLAAPLGFTLEGYTLAFRNPNILTGYMNTIFYVVVGTVCSLAVTAAGAFVTSRRDALLAKPIMLGIIFTMYFSGGLIPLYLLVNNLGLYNTRTAIILVGLVNTWNLIVMRTSYLGIPDSLEESAKIDGATPLRTFTSIYLPLSKPMLATMTLFYGVGNWNSWFNHMIFLRDRAKYPLQLIMREILIANDMSSMTNMNTVGTYTNDMYQVLVKYAVVVIATLPILCVYPFLQRYFIKGVMVGAIKG
ncbi:carbohydrate ABC transporter permease [Oscillospiraceae bacterium 42-9]|uniref:carbohydrate ABC transporter permease n=1 Tax=Acutalibacter sp. TaxID=1918636 RepID=UPI00216DEBB6|nr:carbohydrate ABC transporter permease [Acutalibacter sp.]